MKFSRSLWNFGRPAGAGERFVEAESGDHHVRLFVLEPVAMILKILASAAGPSIRRRSNPSCGPPAPTAESGCAAASRSGRNIASARPGHCRSGRSCCRGPAPVVAARRRRAGQMPPVRGPASTVRRNLEPRFTVVWRSVTQTRSASEGPTTMAPRLRVGLACGTASHADGKCRSKVRGMGIGSPALKGGKGRGCRHFVPPSRALQAPGRAAAETRLLAQRSEPLGDRAAYRYSSSTRRLWASSWPVSSIR